MTLHFRGIDTLFNTSSASDTLDLPAGVVAGDMLLVQIGHVNDVTFTMPDGWTLVAEVTGTDGIKVYSKVAGASEPSTITVTRATGTGIWKAGIVAYMSDRGRVIEVDDFAVQTNASGDRLFPSVTLSGDAGALLCFASLGGNNASTPDAAMTERWDGDTSMRIYLMTQTLSAAGTTGTRTATGTADTSKVVSVALVETDELYTPGTFVTVLEDTYVVSIGDSDKSAAVTFLTNGVVDFGLGHYRGLLRPLHLDEFPAGTIVQSATLYLTNSSPSGAAQRDLVLNSILSANSAWTPGSARFAWEVDSVSRWAGDALGDGGVDAGCSQSGTDFNASALGAWTAEIDTAADTTEAIALDVGQVEAWLAGANHGIVVRRTDTTNFAYPFHSAESTTPGYRPRLEIVFTYPAEAYAVADGHDAALGDLVALTPQPMTSGVKVTRRTHSVGGPLVDEYKYIELIYSALGSVTEFQAVLTAFGVLSALQNEITILCRDETLQWVRFNGTAVRPQMGADINWSRFFPRDIVILVKELVAA